MIKKLVMGIKLQVYDPPYSSYWGLEIILKFIPEVIELQDKNINLRSNLSVHLELQLDIIHTQWILQMQNNANFLSLSFLEYSRNRIKTRRVFPLLFIILEIGF